MSFSEIFWPVLAALLITFILLETFHFLLGRWLAKRYERKQEEELKRQKEDLAHLIASGVDPAILFGGGFPVGTPLPASIVPDPGKKANDESKENDAEVPCGYL